KGGSSISIPSNLDNDSTNELQSLSIDNDTLSLTKSSQKIYLGNLGNNTNSKRNIQILYPSDLKSGLPDLGTIYYDVGNKSLRTVVPSEKQTVDTLRCRGSYSFRSYGHSSDSVIFSFKPRYKNFWLYPINLGVSCGYSSNSGILTGNYKLYTDNDSIMSNGTSRLVSSFTHSQSYVGHSVRYNIFKTHFKGFAELDTNETWCHYVLPITYNNTTGTKTINSSNFYSSHWVWYTNGSSQIRITNIMAELFFATPSSKISVRID
ncbi:MAG: hypothetical protein VXX63_04155, partial [Bacteroidota bacterium]|nr:hypothetical protein [Bacteroidota bacterium]